MQTKGKINFQKQPFTGIFLKIARERGVTSNAIRIMYNMNNYEIVKLVNEEMQNRLNEIKRSHVLIQELTHAHSLSTTA